MYVVTNTVISGNCIVTSPPYTVLIQPLPTLHISYLQPTYCSDDATVAAIQYSTDPSAFTISGFSVIPNNGGLSIDGNGAITPSLSTPGSYKVVLGFVGGPGNCSNTDTAFVTITPKTTGTISYGVTPVYCQNFWHCKRNKRYYRHYN